MNNNLDQQQEDDMTTAIRIILLRMRIDSLEGHVKDGVATARQLKTLDKLKLEMEEFSHLLG